MRTRGFGLQISVAALTILATGVCANASLISEAHPVFGADAITLDTQTGMRFLDLTYSRNRSYNQVTAQLGTGGLFEGFRYATRDEVRQLFIDAGLLRFDVGTTGDRANYPAANDLLNHLGVLSTFTFSDPPDVSRVSNGFTGPLQANNTTRVVHLSVREVNQLPLYGRADLNFFSPPPTFTNAGYGSYLVIAAVPEPSDFALTGSGLLLLALVLTKPMRSVCRLAR